MSRVYVDSERFYHESGIFCPFCGRQDLWSSSDVDGQVGSGNICLECGLEIYIIPEVAPPETISLIRNKGLS